MKKVLFAINTLNKWRAGKGAAYIVAVSGSKKYEIHLLVVFG